jgi:hypothetical protein
MAGTCPFMFLRVLFFFKILQLFRQHRIATIMGSTHM